MLKMKNPHCFSLKVPIQPLLEPFEQDFKPKQPPSNTYSSSRWDSFLPMGTHQPLLTERAPFLGAKTGHFDLECVCAV